ncbi:MAG: MarR family winged helix-turn-helix transcriptional regulator [Pseudolysinimonas sp.]
MGERPLAYWLALVDRLVEERFAGALEEHGVTRTQYRVLGVLAGGPATASDLESAMSDLPPDPAGISAADELAELVESGWVLGGESYTITERGAAAHARLDEMVDGLRATLTGGLSDEEQAATAAALEQMARNLGWTEG